jgi:hypothetical protein
MWQTSRRYNILWGRDSSVDIATRYGLDGTRIESRWRQDFQHLSRPTLGPTQPPVQWKLDHSRGIKQPGRSVENPLPSSAEVKERVDLYLYSTCVPSWQVLERNLLFQYSVCICEMAVSKFVHTKICKHTNCVQTALCLFAVFN